MKKAQSLQELQSIVESMEAELSAWPQMSAAQWNWEPKGEWSIGQILDHILASGDPIVEKIGILAPQIPPAPEHDEIRQTWLGQKVAEQSGPNYTMRVPVPKGMEPGGGPFDDAVRARLLDQLAAIRGLLGQARMMETERFKFSSTVSPLVRYNLADALTILVVHAQRHVIQARNRMSEPGFPPA